MSNKDEILEAQKANAEDIEAARWKNTDVGQLQIDINDINGYLHEFETLTGYMNREFSGYTQFEKVMLNLYMVLDEYGPIPLFYSTNADEFPGKYSGTQNLPDKYANLTGAAKDQYMKLWGIWSEINALEPAFSKTRELIEELIQWIYPVYKLYGKQRLLSALLSKSTFEELDKAINSAVDFMNRDIVDLEYDLITSVKFRNEHWGKMEENAEEYRRLRKADYAKLYEGQAFKSHFIFRDGEIDVQHGIYNDLTWVDRTIEDIKKIDLNGADSKIKSAIEMCNEIEKTALAAAESANDRCVMLPNSFRSIAIVMRDFLDRTSKVVEGFTKTSNEFPYHFMNPLTFFSKEQPFEMGGLKSGGHRNGGSGFIDIIDVAAVSLEEQYHDFMNFQLSFALVQ